MKCRKGAVSTEAVPFCFALVLEEFAKRKKDEGDRLDDSIGIANIGKRETRPLSSFLVGQ